MGNRVVQCCFLVLISIFWQNIVNAQEIRDSTDLQTSLREYFEWPRETLYLHLNKSSYIKGESLWFKGYIYNRQDDLPSIESTNIYVGLYDSAGLQLDKRLFKAKEGLFEGSFKIDSTFSTQNHYIKAYTSWMGNFSEDDSYVQQIEIIDGSIKMEAPLNRSVYEAYFLPEGGHLLNGVRCVLGVKVINGNGKGVPIKYGVVQDATGAQVTEFTTSDLGIGKLTFVPNKGNRYRASIEFLDGTKKIFQLPGIEKEGLALMLSNRPEDSKVVFSISTNTETGKKIRDQEFFAVIHADGESQKVDFTFEDELVRTFSFERSALFKGMNTITVFNERNEPLLERLFYNYPSRPTDDIEFKLLGSEPDSLQIGLKIKNIPGESGDFSISILPSGTLAYNHATNIYSSFFLKPYIKGFVENPAYYFQDVSARKMYDLDALLITQGWSRYSWENIVWNPPELIKDFERGLDIRLVLNTKFWDQGDQILVHRTKNHLEQSIDIPEQSGEIIIKNFFPETNERIYFSLLNSKGKTTKPKLYASILANIRPDNLKIIPKYSLRRPIESFDHVYSEKPLILEDNVIVLDEVTVEEERDKTDIKSNVNVAAYLRSRIEPVDKDLAIRFPFFADLIRSRGFDVFPGPQGGISIRSYRDKRTPLILLDGIQVLDFNWIAQLPLTQVESFYFDEIGTRESLRSGGAEVIYIYTRRGKELNLTPGGFENKNAFEFITEKGFEPKKEYYNPKYSSYGDQLYMDYGVVHWVPSIIVGANGEATFKIPNTGIGSISFYIEGMDPQGNLWSSLENIDIDENGLRKP